MCSRASWSLVTDAGEERAAAGDCAAFKAGDPDGHHLINRSDRDAVVLEIGTRDPDDRCVYPDIDMIGEPGERLPPPRRRALSGARRRHLAGRPGAVAARPRAGA